MARQLEEDVVERWLQDRDVVDEDPGRVERADGFGSEAGCVRHRRVQPAAVAADVTVPSTSGAGPRPHPCSGAASVTQARPARGLLQLL